MTTSGKSADAYRTISEVAEALKLPQHVLRFWETRFPQVKPLKRAGGRRFYRPDDVDLLAAIKALLYGHGYTIKGVQRLLKEQGPRAVAILAERGAGPVPGAEDPARQDRSAPRGDETRQPSSVEAPTAPARTGPAPDRLGAAEGPAGRLRAALFQLAECARILSTART